MSIRVGISGAAAARGVTVFCEKPLATGARPAEEMVDTVERADVVNQVDLLLRFAPQYLMAKHLIEDSAAGRLLAVSFRDDQFIPIQGRDASTWRSATTPTAPPCACSSPAPLLRVPTSTAS